MNTTLTTRFVAAAAMAAASLGGSVAQARGDVTWSIGIGSPGVYVQPAPVYLPQHVYVQPRPVYVQPAPVYLPPRLVYVQPPAYWAYTQPPAYGYHYNEYNDNNGPDWRRAEWERRHGWRHKQHGRGWDRDRDWDRGGR